MSDEPQKFWISESGLATIVGMGLSKGEIVALTHLQRSPYKVIYNGLSLPSILEAVDRKYNRWGDERPTSSGEHP